MDGIKPYLVEQVDGMLELLLAFRGEANDDISAQGYPRYPTAYVSDEMAIMFYCIISPHRI